MLNLSLTNQALLPQCKYKLDLVNFTRTCFHDIAKRATGPSSCMSYAMHHAYTSGLCPGRSLLYSEIGNYSGILYFF